jgi:hypothetical protein
MTLVLDDNQMKKAIKALMSHCEKVKDSGATRQLFEDEGDVFNLQIALKKIPEKVSEKPVGSPFASHAPAALHLHTAQSFSCCPIKCVFYPAQPLDKHAAGPHRASVLSFSRQRRDVSHSQGPPACVQGSGALQLRCPALLPQLWLLIVLDLIR